MSDVARSPGQVRFRRVVIRGFRNIEQVEFEPAARVNVFAGNNGQGKTSLLEALYFSATSRSFRTDTLRELIAQGQEQATVRATIEEDGDGREQRAVLSASTRAFFHGDNKVTRLADYATLTPVVAFHPGDLALVSGPAAGRRRLLDRIGLYLDPRSTFHRHRYERALRERQKSLSLRGPASADLSAYEALMAEHGAQLTAVRVLSAERLIEALSGVFAEIAAPGLSLAASYRPGGSSDPALALQELGRSRAPDARGRTPRFGPHKDDLELSLDQRSSRRHASQGQQRILTLALKVAELLCIRNARGLHPILLLDDVSSELDRGRTDAVYDFLRGTESQIFVTTTAADLFRTAELDSSARRDWQVREGRVSRFSVA